MQSKSSLPTSNNVVGIEYVSHCRPYKLSEEEIQKKLRKVGNVVREHSFQLSNKILPSKMVKKARKMFHSHIVSETESTVLLASKFPNQVKLFIVIKRTAHLQPTAVLQCLGSSEEEVRPCLGKAIEAFNTVINSV